MAENIYPPFFYEGQLILDSEGNLGQVWLSGMHFASNTQLLQKKNITCVISAANLNLKYPASISHNTFDLCDRPEQEIRDSFYPAIRLL